MQIQILFNLLNSATKKMLDTASGGALCSIQLSAAYSFIGEMVNNGHQWSTERNKTVNVAGIYEVDAITTLATQVVAITKRLYTM